jgi:uncharacterized membrane protein YkgB
MRHHNPAQAVAAQPSIVRSAWTADLVAARLALFVVYYWFGILKVFGTSPAGPLVEALLDRTLPLTDPRGFMAFLGVYEMAVGTAFLIPRLQRLALALIVPHLAATALPLIMLPQWTWQSFLVPTLVGQYILKNAVIVALAMTIVARMPQRHNHA